MEDPGHRGYLEPGTWSHFRQNYLDLTFDGKPAFKTVWEGKKAICQHASPLAHKGHAYFVTKVGLDLNIHSGKIFFAASDGIYRVAADTALKGKADDVKANHISLGKDGDKPRRTGAFVNHGHYVLFVSGKEASSALVLLDAKKAEPKPVTVALNVKKGTRAVTPHVAVTPEGNAYAFIFHDHAKGVDVEDTLEVVALDPNGDDECTDARVVKTLKVGTSVVEGHFGHHDMAFDAEKRFAFFTNPGDGTLSVLSLASLEVVNTFKVGGTPTALVALGSRETDD